MCEKNKISGKTLNTLNKIQYESHTHHFNIKKNNLEKKNTPRVNQFKGVKKAP